MRILPYSILYACSPGADLTTSLPADSSSFQHTAQTPLDESAEGWINTLMQQPGATMQQGKAAGEQVCQPGRSQHAQQDRGNEQSAYDPSCGQQMSDSSQLEAKAAVARGWAVPEHGQACSHCGEDQLSDLKLLVPASDLHDSSKRLRIRVPDKRIVLSGHLWRRILARRVNMIISSEFSVSACVHTVHVGMHQQSCGSLWRALFCVLMVSSVL